MPDTLYADGVTEITVVGATARLRFHTLEPKSGGAKGKPDMAPAFTVVMPVEALAQLSDKLPELTQSLLASGRLKKVAPAKPAN